MIQGSVQAMGRVIDAEVRGNDGPFCGVAIDSRGLPKGGLFVALPGLRVDGHDYVQSAANNGAGGALVERFVDCQIAQLKCADATAALGRLGAHWRSQFSLPLIGITGSNGKTSVKTMLGSILRQRHRVLVTQGNLNNELGVPLTLCRLSADDEFAVIEMGAGKPGDIGYLAQLARPDVALINNAGPAHLERLGDLHGVARTKGEMLDHLSDGGTAVLNADDQFFQTWKQRACGRRVMSFGLQQGADVCARWQSSDGGLALTLSTPVGEISAQMNCRGEHNAANAAAAAAAAIALGVAGDQISAGLEAFEPVDGRLGFRSMAGGWQLLEDAYNANPASMSAGLKVLAAQPGERWLIMGDMRELGDEAAALHLEAGREARRLGITRIFALGELSRQAVDGFGSEHAQHFADLEAMVDDLAQAIAEASSGQQPLVCLLKGSRGMQMERVLDGLAQRGVV